MKQAVVIYHRNCLDGLGAFTIAENKLKELGYEVHGFAAQYGEEPVDLSEFDQDTAVYIVDFSYSRDILLQMKEQFPQLLVFDHHASAQKDCEGLDFTIFDMDKSGTRITWEYFYPDGNLPPAAHLIDQGDLWKLDTPNTREFRVSMGPQIKAGITPEIKGLFTHLIFPLVEGKDELTPIVERGSVLLEMQNTIVRNVASRARLLELPAGISAALVITTGFESEIGDYLMTMADSPFNMAIMAQIHNPEKVILSLRSRKGGVDVSEFAKQFGGGGHQPSAGCSVPFETFTEMFKDSIYLEKKACS